MVSKWATRHYVEMSSNHRLGHCSIILAGDRRLLLWRSKRGQPHDPRCFDKADRDKKNSPRGYHTDKDKEYKASDYTGFSLRPEKPTIEMSPFQIPDTSLAKGTYELKAQIIIDNRSIGTIDKIIKVK